MVGITNPLRPGRCASIGTKAATDLGLDDCPDDPRVVEEAVARWEARGEVKCADVMTTFAVGLTADHIQASGLVSSLSGWICHNA